MSWLGSTSVHSMSPSSKEGSGLWLQRCWKSFCWQQQEGNQIKRRAAVEGSRGENWGQAVAAAWRGGAAAQPVRHPCHWPLLLAGVGLYLFGLILRFLFGLIFPFLFRACPSWRSGYASRAEPRGSSAAPSCTQDSRRWSRCSKTHLKTNWAPQALGRCRRGSSNLFGGD